MRNELYKILKSKLLYILIAVIFLAAFIFSLLFNSLKTDEREFGYGVERYTDFVTVSERIEWNEQQLSELEILYEEGGITEEDYLLQSMSIILLNNIYGYLLDNQIQYQDAQTIQHLGTYADNRVSFVKQLSFFMQNFLIICIAITTLYCFNYEFQNGTFKFVYTNGTPRRKVLLYKFLVVLFVYILLSFVYMASVSVFSIPYSLQYSVLIDVVGNSVTGISPTDFICKILFSTFLDNFCWVILFLAISLLFRNTYCAVGVYLLFYVVFQMVFLYIPIEFFNALSVQFFNIHIYGITDKLYAIATAVKYCLFALALSLATVYFLKKDLA